VVFDVNEPLKKQAQFVVAMMLCGAVIACCAVGAARLGRWRSVAAWGLALALCFTAASGAALFYFRSMWNPWPGMVVLGISPQVPLASAPSLAPLVVGVVAVLAVSGLVMLLRAATPRVE
jgi:hypothetical protein